jgi:acyl dehydratase
MSAGRAEAVSERPIQELLGARAEQEFSWEERDVILYALGVGAGQRDAGAELELTTENSAGAPLRAIPTFGVLMTFGAGEAVARGADPAAVVHAEQSLRLLRPLPLRGTVRASAEVVSVYDKQSGALVTNRAVATDTASGEPLLETTSSVFVRGAGGFGGERGPSSDWSAPEGEPDHLLRASVRSDQALLYRLSGDRNPLHSDPAFARIAGFERPILHGLATYGIAARLLFNEICGADPARFRSIRARFSAPVLPGEELLVEAWERAGSVRFRVRAAGERLVMDRGELELGD